LVDGNPRTKNAATFVLKVLPFNLALGLVSFPPPFFASGAGRFFFLISFFKKWLAPLLLPKADLSEVLLKALAARLMLLPPRPFPKLAAACQARLDGDFVSFSVESHFSHHLFFCRAFKTFSFYLNPPLRRPV